MREPATDASGLIAALGLVPHPEGGWYREVHRSATEVPAIPGYPGPRCAMTVIYFLLRSGEFSAFHRLRSEEAWVHLAGAPLEIVLFEEPPRRLAIGPADAAASPVAVVPPGTLQAARPLGPFSLAACLVAPGFEFADFEMPRRDDLLRRHPAHEALIRELTR